MESIESSNPPLPGTIKPESFNSAERFKMDSNKSPMIAMKAILLDKISILYIEPGKASGKSNIAMKPSRIVPRIPPMKPAMLFFLLTVKSPRFPLPKSMPKSQANESQPNTKARKTTR